MIIKILEWTWCLPQTLLGLFIRLLYGGKRTESYYNNKKYVYYTSDTLPGGISLGKYVTINTAIADSYTVKHEHGHQIQSLILGPLYLLVIGLPSLLWAWFIHNLVNKCRSKKGKNTLSYYWFYPEAWANKLGGNN